MIHIDDLVRQRLDGGQEPERPGAWLAMRALLDKEMPAAVAAGTNRRRIIGYITGMLLLATASIGSYKLYNDRIPSGGGMSGGDGLNSPAVNNIAPAINDNNDGNDIQSVSAAVAAQKTDVPFIEQAALASSDNNTNAASLQSVRKNRSSHAANTTPDKTVSTISAPQEAPKQSEAHTTARSHKIDNAIASAIEREISNVPAALPAHHDAIETGSNRTPSAVNPSDRMMASAAGTTVHGRRVAANATQISSARNGLAPASSAAPAAQTAKVHTVPAPVKYVYDTIQIIELVTRRVYDASTQRAIPRVDTLPQGKMIVARAVPQPDPVTTDAPAKAEKRHLSLRHRKPSAGNNSDAVATAGQPGMKNLAVPAAKPPVPGARTDAPAKSDESNNVLAAKHKASGSQFSLWNAERFNAAIDKFKFNLAKIQMYPGLMAGINASVLTPNSLGGFQVGLTSLFALNDWWSLVAEMKYLYRFNTGSTVRDDYMNLVSGSVNIIQQPNGQSYKYYQWQDEHVDHYFNYEVVKTFEVPLALRYNSGRFYTQGGLNFVYSWKIDAAEVTHARGDITSHNKSLPATHDDEPFITNDAPLVRISDFGSRFGTGWVLGGGFMFTREVYLDFRVSQTLWDNAKTQGAKQISNDLLRTPSIQLSVGYRFGQRKP